MISVICLLVFCQAVRSFSGSSIQDPPRFCVPEHDRLISTALRALDCGDQEQALEALSILLIDWKVLPFDRDMALRGLFLLATKKVSPPEIQDRAAFSMLSLGRDGGVHKDGEGRSTTDCLELLSALISDRGNPTGGPVVQAKWTASLLRHTLHSIEGALIHQELRAERFYLTPLLTGFLHTGSAEDRRQSLVMSSFLVPEGLTRGEYLAEQVEELREEESWVFAFSCALLGEDRRTLDPRLTPRLLDQLDAPDPRARIWAAIALDSLAVPASLDQEWLLRFLEGDSMLAQYWALEEGHQALLAEVLRPEAHSKLLYSPHEAIRRRCREVLGLPECRIEVWRDHLQREVRDGAHHAWAAEGLAAFGSAGHDLLLAIAPSVAGERLASVLSVLDPSFVVAGGSRLEDILRAALSSEDAFIRAAAVSAFSRWSSSPDRIDEGIRRGLSDRDPRVQDAAIRGLNRAPGQYFHGEPSLFSLALSEGSWERRRQLLRNIMLDGPRQHAGATAELERPILAPLLRAGMQEDDFYTALSSTAALRFLGLDGAGCVTRLTELWRLDLSFSENYDLMWVALHFTGEEDLREAMAALHHGDGRVIPAAFVLFRASVQLPEDGQLALVAAASYPDESHRSNCLRLLREQRPPLPDTVLIAVSDLLDCPATQTKLELLDVLRTQGGAAACLREKLKEVQARDPAPEVRRIAGLVLSGLDT